MKKDYDNKNSNTGGFGNRTLNPGIAMSMASTPLTSDDYGDIKPIIIGGDMIKERSSSFSAGNNNSNEK